LVLDHQAQELPVRAIRPQCPPRGHVTNRVSLAAVNFFLGCVGVVQVTRIFNYRRSLEGGSAKEAAKDLEHEIADSAKAVAKDAVEAVKKHT
jgi:hypothetical protein